jgi:hypothetical protein
MNLSIDLIRKRKKEAAEEISSGRILGTLRSHFFPATADPQTLLLGGGNKPPVRLARKSPPS